MAEDDAGARSRQHVGEVEGLRRRGRAPRDCEARERVLVELDVAAQSRRWRRECRWSRGGRGPPRSALGRRARGAVVDGELRQGRDLRAEHCRARRLCGSEAKRRGSRGVRRCHWGRARRRAAWVFMARCPRVPRGHRPSLMSVPREGHAVEISGAHTGIGALGVRPLRRLLLLARVGSAPARVGGGASGPEGELGRGGCLGRGEASLCARGPWSRGGSWAGWSRGPKGEER